ncbi:MAG: DUF3842 family protein [Clostridiales bacterium]|nr:DUF3842 family protein [Clostridiales bacterium]
MKILVIDGQGGGLGRAITAALRQALPDLALIALGTNAIATTAMLKAGAQQGATGESAIRWQCRDAGLILGPTGLLTAGALLGEISPAIAAAVGESPAKKLLIPSDRCNVQVIGVRPQSMDDAVRELVARVAEAAGAP